MSIVKHHGVFVQSAFWSLCTSTQRLGDTEPRIVEVVLAGHSAIKCPLFHSALW